MKVIVTSFKPYGKYYTTGEYETDCKFMFQIFVEVEDMAMDGNIPGLAKNAAWTNEPNRADWLLHVESPDHPNNFPGIIPLFRDNEGKRTLLHPDKLANV